MSLEEARDIVARFQKAMAPANARILSNPRPNVHSVLNGSELVKIPQKPPPLDCQGSNSSSSELMRRIRRQMSINQTVPANSSLAYSVSLEVVQAAQMVAEASPPSNSADNYAAVIASLRARFTPKLNDTNIMPQRLKRPSGLLEYVPSNQLRLITQNATAVAGPGIS
jgi:hypothetical protein